MKGLWRAFTQNTAETHAHHPDPRLRGRTYAIPFESVWTAAVTIANGKIRGWRLVEADDERGVIMAESLTLVFRWVDDVRIHVVLDENAQTRVDLRSASRVGHMDLGRNPRTIRRFLKRLDAQLGATASQILDPTRVPDWSL